MVITYRLGDNFIQRLADHVEENYLKSGKEISRLCFVFGGRRPALFLKKELSLRIKKSFIPPRFFSIDEFVDYLLLKKGFFSPISDLDACFSIFTLAKDIAPDILKGRERFCAFLPWAEEILSFIEQLDLDDSQAQLLENIQSKAKIGFDVPENINALLGSIIAIRSSFQELLKKKKTYSRGLKYLLAAEYAGEANLREFEQIFFCGFFYLHKTEEEIIKTLYDKQLATLVFQGSQGDWGVLKSLAEKFSISIEPEEEENLLPNFTVQAGFDVHSQVSLAREALKKISNPSRAVVVLPEPDNLIPLLSEISACVEDFNVSLGYPLRRSSLYELFISIFKAQNNKKGSSYHARDYLAALSHPLIKNLKFFPNPALTRVLVHKIEEVLLGIEESALAGSLFVDLEEIAGSRELYDLAMRTIKSMGLEAARSDLAAAVEKLHQALFKSWEGLDNFLDFSTALDNFISLVVEKGPLGNYPLNLKMAEAVLKVKNELAGAAFNRQKFPSEEIFKIFEEKLKRQAVSFSGTPLKGLQILGLLETRSLNFEHAIILDMNEAVLPSLKVYEPLIPREVMINLGINRLEKEDQIQRYQFMRLVSSAKNTVLIYQDTPEKEKSRFIEELIWKRQKAGQPDKGPLITRASFRLKVLPKRLAVSKDAKTLEFLRSREYSSSSINTYLACPLKFYYQYVLGLKEKEDLLEEPQGRDIGTFVHEFLHEQFSRFLRRKPLLNAAFKKDFFAALEDKFERDFQKKVRSGAFMIKDVLLFRMEKFLEREKQRRVARILSLEKEFSGMINLSGAKIKFKAIVDRIDLLEDKSTLILDYKTGGSEIMPKTDPREIEQAGFTREALKTTIRSFQLPLYLYLVAGQPEFRRASLNACLYLVKDLRKNSGLCPLFKEEEEAGERDVLMKVFLAALAALVQEILDPKVAFKADEKDPRLCAACPFFNLCR